MIVALVGLTASAWTDHPSSARPRDVIALQGELDRLDESIGMLRPRQQPQFQDRVDEIRDDVTRLSEQIRRHERDPDRGLGATSAEVEDLRSRIAALRLDIDAAQGPRDATGSTRLPAGTELDLRLEQRLSSRTARVEDRVEASVVESVVWNGRTVIPAGAIVSGYVADVEDAERMQKDGRLRLEFDSVRLADGTRASIRGRVVSIEERHTGRSTKKKAGLGALLGGVLGGIIEGKEGALIGAVIGAGGAVVATKGQNVELPEGTHLTVRLDAPVQIARR
jgi:hypothetical protein